MEKPESSRTRLIIFSTHLLIFALWGWFIDSAGVLASHRHSAFVPRLRSVIVRLHSSSARMPVLISVKMIARSRSAVGRREAIVLRVRQLRVHHTP